MLPKGVRVGQTCEYVDYEHFQKTAFYNEFLAPRRIALHTLLLAGNERQRLEQAFRSMPVGVLVLNWKLELVYTNPAFDETLAGQELTPSELARIQAVASRTRGLTCRLPRKNARRPLPSKSAEGNGAFSFAPPCFPRDS